MSLKSRILFAFFMLTVCERTILLKAAEQPFTLTISTSRPTIKIGEDVIVTIKVKNISKKPIRIARSNGNLQAEFNYGISFRDANLRPVEETKYEQQINGKIPTQIVGSTVFVLVEPGEMKEDGVLLNKLFDIRKPGVYTLQITRESPDGQPNSPIKSNTISITFKE